MLFKSNTVVGLLNKLHGKSFSAFTVLFLVFYKEGAAEDLLEHEKVHVKQFFMTLGTIIVLYHIPYFRFRFEAEAYRASIDHGLPPEKAIHYLLNDYNLNVTREQVVEKLQLVK